MKVKGKHYRTIWVKPEDPKIIQIIDQTKLPFSFEVLNLKSFNDALSAISDMKVRGAGLIGATAAFGMYLASLNASNQNYKKDLKRAGTKLIESRPTAVNLKWAVDIQLSLVQKSKTIKECTQTLFDSANQIADDDANMCKQIGAHGLTIIEEISKRKNGQVVNILTHCNAGWLAFVDYGSATSPIYSAHDKGLNVHVWVDETRPRNQGARLTAWELQEHGVPHTVIPDNTGGHLMQHGLVDMVITGADRVTRCGDAANKIGTYLKALAAFDNHVPFYVALPSSTFDWEICDGITEIPIEQRNGREVKYLYGLYEGTEKEFLITPKESNVANYGFDVTPARLIKGLISEKGICKASEESIEALHERKD